MCTSTVCLLKQGWLKSRVSSLLIWNSLCPACPQLNFVGVTISDWIYKKRPSPPFLQFWQISNCHVATIIYGNEVILAIVICFNSVDRSKVWHWINISIWHYSYRNTWSTAKKKVQLVKFAKSTNETQPSRIVKAAVERRKWPTLTCWQRHIEIAWVGYSNIVVSFLTSTYVLSIDMPEQNIKQLSFFHSIGYCWYSNPPKKTPEKNGWSHRHKLCLSSHLAYWPVAHVSDWQHRGSSRLD